MKNSEVKNKRGIAILYAVIVAILMVAIGATITSIALRQTILSSTGRESQYAFYAANTGIECARYWDFQYPLDEVAFATSVSSVVTKNELYCNKIQINDSSRSTENGNVTNFTFNIQPQTEGPEYCIEVDVKKIDLSGGGSGKTMGTLITSRGYNVSCENKENPRAVQRGIEMYYDY
jgi:hypothetical protein